MRVGHLFRHSHLLVIGLIFGGLALPSADLAAKPVASSPTWKLVATHSWQRIGATPRPTPSASPQPVAQSSAPIARPAARRVTALTAGQTLYVDPNNSAAAQATAWRSSRPNDAAVMDKLAATPTAHWMGDWTADPTGEASRYTTAAAAAGALPVLVLYNIPGRDCGLYSSGGAKNAATYAAWIDAVARGVSNRPAIIILEPDALPELGCTSVGSNTLDLLHAAVVRLKQDPGVRLYLDAGNAGWQPAGVMAPRLQAAGIGLADGFSLNVSNFMTTSQSITYGRQLSALVGGQHFVIDTSRNGNGSDGGWCNPPNRALGLRPTTDTGQALADAYLWIKTPGESDGDCGRGEPAAGQWWADYALGLARLAGY